MLGTVSSAPIADLVELVEGQGGGVQNVYKLVIYITDVARKDEVNKARAAFFKGAFPCSTLVEVKGLVFPDLLVEIEAHATAPGRRRD